MQSLRKPVAVLLSILMILSAFSAMAAVTASAADETYKVTLSSAQNLFQPVTKLYKPGDKFQVKVGLKSTYALIDGTCALKLDASALAASKMTVNSAVPGVVGNSTLAYQQDNGMAKFSFSSGSSFFELNTDEDFVTFSIVTRDGFNSDQTLVVDFDNLRAGTVTTALDDFGEEEQKVESKDMFFYILGNEVKSTDGLTVTGALTGGTDPVAPTEPPTTVPPTEPPTTEPPTTVPVTEPTEKTYYLFGYINGANYGCEDDSANMGDYKFVDGKLKATFTEDSYVAVKEEGNANWYMTNGWLGTDVTSAVLYNTSITGEDSNKLYVPGNVEVSFTLADNGDGSFTLSYTLPEPQTEPPTTEPPTTEPPTTEPPTTEPPTTEPPTTEPPTTEPPTTEPPTTEPPTTEPPTTEPPTTEPPTTEPPTTEPPTTEPPTTEPPTTEPPTTEPVANTVKLCYIPSAQQVADGDTFFVNYQDTNGDWHQVAMKDSGLKYGDRPIYAAEFAPATDGALALQYQVYDSTGKEWKSQTSFENVSLSKYDGKIIDGETGRPTDEPGTEPPTTEPPTTEPPTTEPPTTEPPTEEPTTAPAVLQDGYYIVGNINGDNSWADNIHPELLLTESSATPGVYELKGVALKAGDLVKIVSVANNEVTGWFPEGMGNDFSIKADGNYDISFRPDGQGEDNWWDGENGRFFSVVDPNAPTEPVTTEPPTQAPTTEPPTQAPTEAPTQAPTEAPTEKATDPKTGPVGPGADISKAEESITKSKTEEPKGATFGKLSARASKVAKTSITVAWNKVSGAKKYIIYANKCGTGNKFKKLKTLGASKKSFNVTKVAGKKLKKGTYYKFLIVAVNSKNKVITTAKTLHIATTGGKVGNYTKVTTVAKKNKVTLAKKGKKFNLKAKAVKGKLTVKQHRKIQYETSNKKIATVSSKGVITAKKKGTCYVYVYAQSGKFLKIKVTVKK